MSQIESNSAQQTQAIFDVEKLRNIVDSLLQEAKKRGATAAEAGLTVESGLQVSVRMGEVETIEYNKDKGLGITVLQGKRKGSASTTDFSEKAISDTVQSALDIARYTQEDKYAGLIDEKYLAHDYPDLELYHPWDISAEQGIEIAMQCEDAARAVDKRITNSEGAYVTSHGAIRVYGNSLGFLGDYKTTRQSLGCAIIASENDKMERDYWYSLDRNASKLEAPKLVGEQAANRSLKRLNARHLKTQKAPVVFQAEVARGLLGHLVRALSGGALYRKASFLLDKLEQKIFPDSFNISEAPHLIAAIGSSPFDNEGAATRKHSLVEDGILQSYVLDSYAARRLDLEPTGNAGGVHNLSINSNGTSDLEALLKTMDTGLLVTEVMGQGINIVTGDYSRGAGGFWVEGGEIQYPVEEITIASNLAQMFENLSEVGCDIDTRSSLQTGSWLLNEMTIAGGAV